MFLPYTTRERGWDSRMESACDILCLGYPLLGCLWLGHFDLRFKASFSGTIPSFEIKWVADLDAFTSGTLANKMFLATAMVAVLLLLLSLFHCPSKAYNKLLHHAVKTIRIFTFGTHLFSGAFFFQMCYCHGRGLGRLGAFQLSQREETHCLGFAWFISSLTTRWFHHLFLLSLPCSLKIVRVCLPISTGFQIGHHGLELFWESAVEMITLQLGYMVWGKAFWE